MALLRFIPSKKTVEFLCFLVLIFAHKGYFFGDECPSESSLLCGVPPLDCRQIQQVRDAIADGTVDRIREALAAGGPIFVGNSSFPPIVELTEAQECAIERCFGSFPPIPDQTITEGSARRKRGAATPGLACTRNIGAVQYTVDANGNCAQVVVDNMPSSTLCTNADGGCDPDCCCEQTFMVKSYGIVLCNVDDDVDIDFFAGDLEVNHCTCCN
ncbi:hypothetical protein HOLleu_28863 [Holothuria leucospilota]|uniref:Uncharacterized protein n=1 Tax=Holothuria leucospilota TaxID=206669 RepID=A0A9Q1BN29_HOLLE|nr:hypothetical protein HOLleu_28863 [Holothuria leucospilota]